MVDTIHSRISGNDHLNTSFQQTPLSYLPPRYLPPAGVDSSFRWNDETVVILAYLLPAGRLRSVLVIN